MKRAFACVLLLFLLVVTSSRAEAQWTQFRGPNGSGVDAATGYPVEFSATRNVAWKIAIPFGQSSPIVVGTRLYVTGSDGERLITVCIDTRTGQELWRREVKRERVTDVYKANDPASPTPAADESGVVAFFSDFGLVSYTADGAPRWTSRLGPFKSFYGMSGSPIIAGGMVVMVCDQQSGSFVVAIDQETGRVRWRTERPGVRPGWATPIVSRAVPSRTDVIVLGSTRIDAYDLASGAARWWTPIGSGDAMGTALLYRDTVVAVTLGSTSPGLPAFATMLAQYDKDKDGRLSHAEFRGDKELGEHFGWIDDNRDNLLTAQEWTAASSMYIGESGAVAVRPGTTAGRLQPSAVQWRFQKNTPYIPAPLLYQDVLYLVKTGGIVTSLNPATGQLLKEGRAPGAIGEYYASPVAADGKVYLANTEGKMTVLKAGAQWEVLGVNDLGEEVHATPALSAGRLYVRTRGMLYCFAGPGK